VLITTCSRMILLMSLRHLNVEGSAGLDGSCLVHIATLTSLTYLDISYLPKLGTGHVRQLAALIDLRDLNISGALSSLVLLHGGYSRSIICLPLT